MSYCELHCCSAFSFLRGGSFPEQLAEVAAELEMGAGRDRYGHSGLYVDDLGALILLPPHLPATG